MLTSIVNLYNYSANFATLLPDASTRSYVTTCLPTSSGDIISVIGGGATNSLTSISNTLSTLNVFNASDMVTKVNDAFTNMTSYVEKFRSSQIIDITDTSSLSLLDSISDSANYGTPCAAATGDSWIPSVTQDTSNLRNVTCKVTASNAGAT